MAMVAAALHGANVPEAPRPVVKSVVRTDARTGKLVRAVVVTPRVVHATVIAPQPAAQEESASPEPDKDTARAAATFREAVDQIAVKHNLPPALVHSVIRVESNYNPYAISPKGAQGLMQLIPSTARRFGVDNAFNPVQNLEGGVRYLKYLLELYHNDYRLALAAYNAGEGAVARYGGGVPPYKETINYLQQVRKRLMEARASEKPKIEAKPEPPKPADHNVIREVREPDGKVRYVSQ
jgi:soluble lytic murein transglycosylase-like protein